MIKNILAWTFLLALTFTMSCSTDVDITDTSQGDIPVVYGLLDPNQDSHFVKVSRTFLGEENNFQLAKIKDSSVIENIQVIIERKIYGEVQEVYNLFPVEKSREDDGDFFEGTQMVYAFYDPNLGKKVAVGDDYFNYELSIIQNEEVIASSSCQLVHEVVFNDDPTYNRSIFQSDIKRRELDFTRDIVFNGIKPPENSKVGTLKCLFYFENVYQDGRSEVDSLIFNFGSSFLRTSRSSETMNFDFTGSVFFDRIAQEIPDLEEEEGLAYRRLKPVDLTFTASTEDLYFYTEVNDPDNSSFQERPSYSNVENGIGIFTSRATTFRNDIEKNSGDLTIDADTRKALLEGFYIRKNTDTDEDETILTNTGKKGFCFDSCP